MEGDSVSRYGQFASLYISRKDLGIVWPSDALKRGLGEKDNLMEGMKKLGGRQAALGCTLVVPSGTVWLEGDCPLFSVDSRHYGPIDTSSISGRLVFRLWPWYREEMTGIENSKFSSCWVNRTRPVPYQAMETYLGKRFGFYRIPKLQNEPMT
jgi:hypothetical protein